MAGTTLKITVISDTHGEHEKLGSMSGDVLVHCGDMFNMFSGRDDEVDSMDDWFGRQEFDLILCIGGNHDFELEKRSATSRDIFRNAVYLEGSSFEYAGVSFHGAPWIPHLIGQAFFRNPAELAQLWAEVPGETDVLITHTPPAGVLDVSSRGLELGCPYLSDALGTISPKLHCFGHVHASSGIYESPETTHINAALVNSRYQLSRDPVVHHLEL